MVIIKGRNYTLRPYRKGDEESLQKNINDKEITRNTLTVPYPYTMKDARWWIRNAHKQTTPNLRFAIDVDGSVVGCVSLESIVKGYKAEIGYWLGRDYWGKGIMTDAVKKITAYGFKRLNLKRIYANVFLFNKSSARVLERAGYKLEGTHRRSIRKNGKFMDELVFAKIKA